MDNLATFIVSCDESFAVVERPAFRKLVDYLRPGVDLPSRRQISSHIMGMHTTQRSKLRASVARISSKISFTTDIWTAPNQKSFMAITFHYLTHEFRLTSGLLDFHSNDRFAYWRSHWESVQGVLGRFWHLQRKGILKFYVIKR